MLIERIEAIPDLRGQITDVHHGGVVEVSAEEGGPTWTVGVVSDRGAHRADIARIIRTLQGKYDLED
ncbi:hypothetical protein [Variovorax paradoxus]|uniref:hypothetical protein n=1 Tax=Variovorax paradoxus TaxID=34073 RepID=UPI00285A35E2|nr:hypothetical protein [Variovorax paradoxus]MDR6453935.1 hypothetical protein [Variovorax paradoxus]